MIRTGYSKILALLPVVRVKAVYGVGGVVMPDTKKMKVEASVT
jgi:hypothetical protein